MPWLPKSEAARLLNVSTRTLTRGVADGMLKAKFEGGRVLVEVRDETDANATVGGLSGGEGRVSPTAEGRRTSTRDLANRSGSTSSPNSATNGEGGRGRSPKHECEFATTDVPRLHFAHPNAGAENESADCDGLIAGRPVTGTVAPEPSRAAVCDSTDAPALESQDRAVRAVLVASEVAAGIAALCLFGVVFLGWHSYKSSAAHSKDVRSLRDAAGSAQERIETLTAALETQRAASAATISTMQQAIADLSRTVPEVRDGETEVPGAAPAAKQGELADKLRSLHEAHSATERAMQTLADRHAQLTCELDQADYERELLASEIAGLRAEVNRPSPQEALRAVLDAEWEGRTNGTPNGVEDGGASHGLASSQ